MNEKIAREARQVNRALGMLAKKSEPSLLPSKLPRKVKRHWAKLSHKARGKLHRAWSGVVAKKRAERPETR